MTPGERMRLTSWAKHDIASFIDMKRALGRKYDSEERLLRHLDQFLARRFPSQRDLSVAILERWLASRSLQTSTRRLNLSIVRTFSVYRRRRRPTAFVPDRIAHPMLWPPRAPKYLPHIFSVDELRTLLRAAKETPAAPGNPHRAQTVFTFVLLLYSTGLRSSEAARLQVSDLDRAAGTLLVRESKFNKTRLIVVPDAMLRELTTYVDRLPSETRRPERPLFQRAGGRPYTQNWLACLTTRALRSCGVKAAKGGPRVHDLRHTFAVHRIAEWYRTGVDVQNRMPILATYMGHRDIALTQYYVTITREILAHAAERFERAFSIGRS